MKKNIGLILIGVGIGLALAVAGAYIFGPYDSTTKMNLFTGNTWTQHNWLWHRWQTEQPATDYTKWARSHLDTDHRYWPVTVSSKGHGWFSGMGYSDYAVPRNIPKIIYNLEIPEEEKIELLHDFHEELGDISSAESDKEPADYKLCERWYEKLKENP